MDNQQKRNYSNLTKKTEKTETAGVVLKPVVKASVQKKSTITKLTDVFFADDLSNVMRNLISDVLIPAVKRTASELIKNGTDMLIWGERRDTSSSNMFTSRVNYSGFFASPSTSTNPFREQEPPARRDVPWTKIRFKTRGDAETVLVIMKDIIDQFGTASISNLYELADISTENFMMNRYGWKSLNDAYIKPVQDGYTIIFPKPVPLN